MKGSFLILGAVALGIVLLPSVTWATSADLNESSGPWYLSDPVWFDQAKADMAAGTFVNGQTGTYPGTTHVDPVDFLNGGNPDGPHLLYFFYFIPNTNVSQMQGLIETKLVMDWAGTEYALAPDHVNWIGNATPETGWGAPGALEDISGGVFGHMRFSWNMTSLGDNTVEDYRQSVLSVQDYVRGEVRVRTDNSDWEYSTLQAEIGAPIPEPMTMTGLGLAVMGLAGYLRRRKAA